MEWALTGAPGVDQLAVYESRLNFILPLYHDASFCAYDVTRFPPLCLRTLHARTHICSSTAVCLLVVGCVKKNPHYVPQHRQPTVCRQWAHCAPLRRRSAASRLHPQGSLWSGAGRQQASRGQTYF
jgi:hypothetical protein